METVDEHFAALIARNYVVMLAGRRVVGPGDVERLLLQGDVQGRENAARKAIEEARNEG